jgi:hypothetical protein
LVPPVLVVCLSTIHAFFGAKTVCPGTIPVHLPALIWKAAGFGNNYFWFFLEAQIGLFPVRSRISAKMYRHGTKEFAQYPRMRPVSG